MGNVNVKVLAGVGVLSFNDEVQVSLVQIIGADEVQLELVPQPTALDTTVYNITLYLDGVVSGTDTVQFTSTEITNGTSRFFTFTGLALSAVTHIVAEVGI